MKGAPSTEVEGIVRAGSAGQSGTPVCQRTSGAHSMRLHSHRRISRPIVLLLSTALVAGAASSASAHDRGHHHSNKGHPHSGTLYVSPNGKSGAADRNCASAAYSTIQSAVDAASRGATVVVCRGSYTEDVIMSTPLALVGRHGAVVHGSATANGSCDQLGPSGPGSAPCLAGITIKSGHVTVEGLTVTGAIGEGILATGSSSGHSISHVVIKATASLATTPVGSRRPRARRTRSASSSTKSPATVVRGST